MKIKPPMSRWSCCCLLALFVSGVLGGEAVAQATLTSPARLLRGPEAVHGLPFFAPNAIPSLYGEYSLGAQRVGVWSSRSAVVLGSAWKALPAESGPGLKAYSLARSQGAIFALAGAGYTLFFELPADSAALRRFALALEAKFRVFFQNAPTDAELSFPAWVDFLP